MSGTNPVAGTDGNDTLGASGDGVTIFGGLGGDQLTGGTGDEVILGAAPGVDEPSDDSLYGRDGADTLRGGSGNDYLEGGTGDDVLDGGPGDDLVLGGGGNDVAILSGNRADYTAGPYLGALAVFGPDGFNRFLDVERFRFADGEVSLEELVATAPPLPGGETPPPGGETPPPGGETPPPVTGANPVLGTEGADTLTASGDGVTIIGGGGEDVLTGGTGDEVILGAAPDTDEPSSDNLFGHGGTDRLLGGGGADYLDGGEGADTLDGGAGDDTILGGGGLDVAVLRGNRADYTVTLNGGLLVLADGQAGRDGTDSFVDVESFRFADGEVSQADLAAGQPPPPVVEPPPPPPPPPPPVEEEPPPAGGGDPAPREEFAGFGGGRAASAEFGAADGWAGATRMPRLLGDVNGDGAADIVGFGETQVRVALADNGAFLAAEPALDAFTPGSGGWISEDRYPRLLGDVNGDGRDDILGFGSSGVFLALADGQGGFLAPQLATNTFTSDAGGWTNQDRYTRLLGDVNGDGRDDIVGFGASAVYVALADGQGGFGAAQVATTAFTSDAGGWSSNDLYTRLLGDVNGDGREDIVGFGAGSVFVALADGQGGFGAARAVLDAFTPNAGGWVSDTRYPRMLGDVDGDGDADIIGFGESSVIVALADGQGGFAAPQAVMAAYTNAAGGWTDAEAYPRAVADVNGDGIADILGFGASGVSVSLGSTTII